MLWYQKSHERWVKYGNKNTKNFHTQTVIHRRKNKIVNLMVDNICCSNKDTLKREALSFYREVV